MGNNKRGSNRTVGNIKRKGHDSGDSRPILEKSVFHPLQHHDNIAGNSQPISGTHLQGTRTTKKGYFRQRLTIRIRIHERDLPTNGNRSKSFYSLSPSNRRTDGTSKSRIGRIP